MNNNYILFYFATFGNDIKPIYYQGYPEYWVLTIDDARAMSLKEVKNKYESLSSIGKFHKLFYCKKDIYEIYKVML